MSLVPYRSGLPALEPQTFVEVDPEGRNVALVVGDSQFVFSTGSDHVEAHQALLYRWATNCRFAAAALGHGQARLRARQRGATPLLVAEPTHWPCALCERANPTRHPTCHWCGNPLGSS